MPTRELVAAVGGNEQDGQILQPASNHAQEVKACSVRPVKVFEDNRERLFGGNPRQRRQHEVDKFLPVCESVWSGAVSVKGGYQCFDT